MPVYRHKEQRRFPAVEDPDVFVTFPTPPSRTPYRPTRSPPRARTLGVSS
jgi:hypothetical protein